MDSDQIDGNDGDGDGFALAPALTYNDERGAARVRAQGINCLVTGPMFELAEHHGGLRAETTIPDGGLRHKFNHVVSQPFRVRITVEPVDTDAEEAE